MICDAPIGLLFYVIKYLSYCFLLGVMADVTGVIGEIIKFQKDDEVDQFTVKKLNSAYYEHRAIQRTPLAELRWVVNGNKRLSLLESFLEFEELRTLEIHFFKPNMKQNWDYDVPTKKVVLLGHGLGGVETFHYDSLKLNKWDLSQGVKRSKVMIRGFISNFYYPMSIKTKLKDDQDALNRIFIPELMTLENIWQIVRTTGVVPFTLHLCLYTQTERITYYLDLVNNQLIKDFRSGVISVKEKANRSSMDNYNFDRVLASTDMKDKVKKVFIALYDMNHATASDISFSFGMTDNMARNCLEALVTRGFASKEGVSPREVYEINSLDLEEAVAKMDEK